MSADRQTLKKLGQDLVSDLNADIWNGKLDDPQKQADVQYAMLEHLVLAAGTTDLLPQVIEALCDNQQRVTDLLRAKARALAPVLPALFDAATMERPPELAPVPGTLPGTAPGTQPGPPEMKLGDCDVCRKEFRWTGSGTMADPYKPEPMLPVHPKCLWRLTR